VACTVGSIVGYLVQQFIIGTGIAKVLGKLKDAGKFASLGKKFTEAGKALGKAVDKVKDVGKSIKTALRGTAEAVQKAQERS
jgi:DNA anti-recombination protein RmuC